MLIQNIYNLNYVGGFGNANPHFFKDWIEVEKPPSENLNVNA
jgi:hypothetical protein